MMAVVADQFLIKKGNLLGLMAFRLRDDGKYILGMSFMIPARTINEFVNEGK